MAKHDNTKGTTRDVNAAMRVQTAMKLYTTESLSWDDIAARAGYGSRGAAHNAVMRELDRCMAKDTKEVEELRRKQFYMLSVVHARCYKASIDEANEDWLCAADRFNALSKRMAELMGLDAEKDGLIVAPTVIREVPMGLLPMVMADEVKE